MNDKFLKSNLSVAIKIISLCIPSSSIFNSRGKKIYICKKLLCGWILQPLLTLTSQPSPPSCVQIHFLICPLLPQISELDQSWWNWKSRSALPTVVLEVWTCCHRCWLSSRCHQPTSSQPSEASSSFCPRAVFEVTELPFWVDEVGLLKSWDFSIFGNAARSVHTHIAIPPQMCTGSGLQTRKFSVAERCWVQGSSPVCLFVLGDQLTFPDSFQPQGNFPPRNTLPFPAVWPWSAAV